jgi:hypothetical protein
VWAHGAAYKNVAYFVVWAYGAKWAHAACYDLSRHWLGKISAAKLGTCLSGYLSSYLGSHLGNLLGSDCLTGMTSVNFSASDSFKCAKQCSNGIIQC